MAVLALSCGLAVALTACGGSDDEAATTTGTTPAPPAATAGTGAPAATAPAATTHGTRPAAAARDDGVDVQQGQVAVSDLHVYRYGREVTVAMNLDGPAETVVAVFGERSRSLAQGTVRRGSAGPVVARLRLPKPQGGLRVIISVVPSGGGDPTVVSLRTRRARPRFAVLSPRPRQVVHGSDLRVRLTTRAFRVTDQGTAPRPRQGHFHITLDTRTYVVRYGTGMTFTGLKNGRHTLLVVAARNDHTPMPGLDPITVRFRVVSAFRLDPRALARRSYRLLPRAGVTVDSTPPLAWGRLAQARRYRVTVRSAKTGVTVFARTTAGRTARIASGLRPGVYVWSVRGLTGRRSQLLARSWFRVR